jgi:hypothetical protein
LCDDCLRKLEKEQSSPRIPIPMYSMVFFYNLLHKLFTLIRTYWLIIFYRLLLYPLLGLVQRRGGLVDDLQFMNLGFDEEEEAAEEQEKWQNCYFKILSCKLE